MNFFISYYIRYLLILSIGLFYLINFINILLETPVSAGLVDEPKKLLKRRYDDSLNQERTVVNDSIILEQISRVLKNVGLPDSVIERRLTNFDHHCSECRVAREPPPLHEVPLFFLTDILCICYSKKIPLLVLYTIS
jgi:hypothetical protein